MGIGIIYHGLRLWRLGFIDESEANGSAGNSCSKSNNYWSDSDIPTSVFNDLIGWRI